MIFFKGEGVPRKNVLPVNPKKSPIIANPPTKKRGELPSRVPDRLPPKRVLVVGLKESLAVLLQNIHYLLVGDGYGPDVLHHPLVVCTMHLSHFTLQLTSGFKGFTPLRPAY